MYRYQAIGIIPTFLFTILAGEFGIVYKGCLAGQYTDDIVAIKTLKGIRISVIGT